MAMVMGSVKPREQFNTAESPYILVNEENGSDEVRISNLTVRIPGIRKATLVENLDLTFKAGERIVITGESGTGKTTVAKAFLNQWDYGTGSISIPSGLKVMAMSQEVYFADLPLRGLLNNAPEGQETFDDSELTRVLHDSDLSQLVQHIPGQQIHILIQDLVNKIDNAADTNTAEDIKKSLLDAVPDLVAEQFDVVQYTPDRQREFAQTQFADLLERKLKTAPSQQTVSDIADSVCDAIDIALVSPLHKGMAKMVKEYAERKGRLFPMTDAKINYLTYQFFNRLKKNMKRYLANEDTDDKSRLIYLNKKQTDYLTRSLVNDMKDTLKNKGSNGALSQTFNAVTWPVSLLSLRGQANSFTKKLTHRLSLFMDKNIVRGDMFKMQLSGGQRQKLMFARILLHKPDILVLDEITAALDVETGEKLYKMMMDNLPEKTTVISIAHNPHIKKYHTMHAHLENKTITMTPIKADTGTNDNKGTGKRRHSVLKK